MNRRTTRYFLAALLLLIPAAEPRTLGGEVIFHVNVPDHMPSPSKVSVYYRVHLDPPITFRDAATGNQVIVQTRWETASDTAYSWDGSKVLKLRHDRLRPGFDGNVSIAPVGYYWWENRCRIDGGRPQEVTLKPLVTLPRKFAQLLPPDLTGEDRTRLLKAWKLVDPMGPRSDDPWEQPSVPFSEPKDIPHGKVYELRFPGCLPVKVYVNPQHQLITSGGNNWLPADEVPAGGAEPVVQSVTVTGRAPAPFESMTVTPAGRVVLSAGGQELMTVPPEGKINVLKTVLAALDKKVPLADLDNRARLRFIPDKSATEFFEGVVESAWPARLLRVSTQPKEAVRLVAAAKAYTATLTRPEGLPTFAADLGLEVWDGQAWHPQAVGPHEAARWDTGGRAQFLPAAFARKPAGLRVRLTPAFQTRPVETTLGTTAPLVCVLGGWEFRLPVACCREREQVVVRLTSGGGETARSLRLPAVPRQLVAFPDGGWGAWKGARVEVWVPGHVPLVLPAVADAEIAGQPRPERDPRPVVVLVNDLGPNTRGNQLSQDQADLCYEMYARLAPRGRPTPWRLRTLALGPANRGNFPPGTKGVFLDMDAAEPNPDIRRHAHSPDEVIRYLHAFLTHPDGGRASARCWVLFVTPYSAEQPAAETVARLRRELEDKELGAALRVLPVLVGAPARVTDDALGPFPALRAPLTRAAGAAPDLAKVAAEAVQKITAPEPK